MIWKTRKDELYDEIDDLKAEIKRIHTVMILMESQGLSIIEATQLEKMHKIMKVS